MSIKVRFAPSPTGMLHVGNARTALVTWLFTRKNGGGFLLRIDDTDKQRSKPEFETAIEDALMWMGLDWDEKANQKDRFGRYGEVIELLKKEGYLYPCYETPEELGLKRKTQLSTGKPPIYDRAALELSDEKIKGYEKEGRKPHWRFKLSHDDIVWNDLIRGETRFKGSDLSDPVVIREDGSPLYHLCSVIDDSDYDITHVVRGEDHVSNTACHIQMFEAVNRVCNKAKEHKIPEFAHLPLISDIEGGKLSKRVGSLSVNDIREVEKLESMAFVSMMARLGTSDPIEPFTDIKSLIETFDFAKFSRGTPKFDPAELIRLNAKILHNTDFENVNVRLANMGLQDVDEDFWLAVRANLERLEDIKIWWQIINGDVSCDNSPEDVEYTRIAADLLPPQPWDGNTWGEWISAIKKSTGRKGKALFMPIRKALTGMEHGPELKEILPLLTPEKVKARLGKNSRD